MSGGTFNAGSVAKVLVGTADPPTIELEGCKTAAYRGTRPSSNDDFYMEPSVTDVGKATRTIPLTGKCKSGAPGLILLKANFDDDTGTTIFGAVSIEGSKGDVLPSRVSDFEVGLPDVNGKCTYSFTLQQAADPTQLAGGDTFD
jgi:hypothetical protein